MYYNIVAKKMHPTSPEPNEVITSELRISFGWPGDSGLEEPFLDSQMVSNLDTLENVLSRSLFFWRSEHVEHKQRGWL